MVAKLPMTGRFATARVAIWRRPATHRCITTGDTGTPARRS
jgi:hypothetical protein